MAVFMGEGAVEDVPDVSHGVDTDRGAPEHRAEKKGEKSCC